MKRAGIVGNGPYAYLPQLKHYQKEMDFWIGADRGAFYLAEQGLPIDIALGDFDSVSAEEYAVIEKCADYFDTYPSMKDETDLEIAADAAIANGAEQLFFFGVTGGRMDHTLMNIQLLYPLLQQGKRAVIIDSENYIEMFAPGCYTIEAEEDVYISFLAFTPVVTGLTLADFLYPLSNQKLHWGSSLCISNELSQKKGTFSFHKGILILVKSFDAV